MSVAAIIIDSIIIIGSVKTKQQLQPQSMQHVCQKRLKCCKRVVERSCWSEREYRGLPLVLATNK